MAGYVHVNPTHLEPFGPSFSRAHRRTDEELADWSLQDNDLERFAAIEIGDQPVIPASGVPEPVITRAFRLKTLVSDPLLSRPKRCPGQSHTEEHGLPDPKAEIDRTQVPTRPAALTVFHLTLRKAQHIRRKGVQIQCLRSGH